MQKNRILNHSIFTEAKNYCQNESESKRHSSKILSHPLRVKFHDYSSAILLRSTSLNNNTAGVICFRVGMIKFKSKEGDW